MTDLFPRRTSDRLGTEDPEVVERLQDQAETIQDLRQMVEYQVSLQTSLVREIDCLKDQVDLLREQWHNHSDSSGCRFEEEEGGERIGNFASLASLVQPQPPSLLEHSYTVSQPSLAMLQSTTDIARLEDKERDREREICSSTSKLKPLVKVVKKKLSRELPGAVALVSSSGQGRESEHIYVNNYDYADFYQTQDKARAPAVKIAQTRDGVYSAESDSGLDVTPEGTPYTSRPESELLISDDKQEDDIKASPRQLEIMMKESGTRGKTDR